MNRKDYERLVMLGVEGGLAGFFVDFDIPMMRKPQKKGNRQWPRLEIGGDCLRAGKTTTKKVLIEQFGAKGLPFVFSDEDWKSNPYLQKGYEEGSVSLLKSQIWFANKKKEQLQRISDSGIWVQVVNPEMDFGYAMSNLLLGRLSRTQFDKYWKEYRALGWGEVPFPDLLVYVSADKRELATRFKRVARDFEQVDEKYIEVMQIVNQCWLRQAKMEKLPVLELNTSSFDYSYESGSEVEREKLGLVVVETLEKQGWKL